MTIYCGRDFSAADIQTIRDLMAQDPKLQRSPLSRQLCELFGWFKPNGGLKDMTCRVALLRMQADGLITLAPSRKVNGSRRPDFPATSASDPQPALLQPVHEIGALTLRLVTRGPVSHLWNEYVQRYHYLGYTPMSGSQLRYKVYAGDRLLALLSFGASAWKLAARDSFIGWQEPQRLKNLPLVVNNARFLILPWIQCKGLASKVLSIVNRQLPNDWHQRYGLRPVLVETFVETGRHRGTSYRAARHEAETRCPTTACARMSLVTVKVGSEAPARHCAVRRCDVQPVLQGVCRLGSRNGALLPAVRQRAGDRLPYLRHAEHRQPPVLLRLWPGPAVTSVAIPGLRISDVPGPLRADLRTPPDQGWDTAQTR